MASATLLTTDTAWSQNGLNSNNAGLKVGNTSDDKKYYGSCAFAAIPSTYTVQQLTLYLNRTDTYKEHKLLIGGNCVFAYDSALAWSTVITVPQGQTVYAWDLTPYARTIQSWNSAWFLHVRPVDDSDSYCEFVGDEGNASTKPRLLMEYGQGLVYYGVNGKWQPCMVYYGIGGKWVQVIPYYGTGGKWVQV